MEGNIHPVSGSVVSGQSPQEKNSLQGIYIFVSLNWIMYLLKSDVLGYQQAFSDHMN